MAEPNFQEQLERLEEIVRRLEAPDLDLDAALKLFEEGVERLRQARERLTAAEAKVRQVLATHAGIVFSREALLSKIWRGDTFVIQQHHARSLHWDLRLERDGVLVSWAVPRGLPKDPARNHLAVHTEDHPMEYADFHGEIPAGEYGAGRMTIYDKGTYTTEKWRDREVIVVLRGEHVQREHARGEGGLAIHAPNHSPGRLSSGHWICARSSCCARWPSR